MLNIIMDEIQAQRFLKESYLQTLLSILLFSAFALFFAIKTAPIIHKILVTMKEIQNMNSSNVFLSDCIAFTSKSVMGLRSWMRKITVPCKDIALNQNQISLIPKICV